MRKRRRVVRTGPKAGVVAPSVQGRGQGSTLDGSGPLLNASHTAFGEQRNKLTETPVAEDPVRQQQLAPLNLAGATSGPRVGDKGRGHRRPLTLTAGRLSSVQSSKVFGQASSPANSSATGVHLQGDLGQEEEGALDLDLGDISVDEEAIQCVGEVDLGLVIPSGTSSTGSGSQAASPDRLGGSEEKQEEVPHVGLKKSPRFLPPTPLGGCTEPNADSASSTGRQGCKPRKSAVWEHFRLREDPRLADCLLCGKEISRGKVIGHLTNSGMQHHLKTQHTPVLRHPRTSVVWEHFRTQEDPRLVECLLCGREVSRGRVVGHLTNSGMLHHLKTQHSPVLRQTPAGKGGPSGSVTTDSAKGKRKGRGRGARQKTPSDSETQSVGQQQTKMEQMRWGHGTLTQGGRKAAATDITRCIGEMIALDDQPFSVVEDTGFKRLMQMAFPRYKMPSRTTFSRNVVPSLYRACKDRVKAQLAKAEGHTVHFTSDIWSSQSAQHAYLSLTAHWWQLEEAELVGSHKGTAGYRWALLHAQVLDQNYTSAHILQAINRMVEGWLSGVSAADVSRGFMVTDGGSNMKNAVRDGKFVDIHCLVHILHLAVRDALGLGEKGGTSTLRDLIDMSRKITGHFNRSVKSRQLLREKQLEVGVPQQRLLQDVSIRWTSTYLMLERLVEQQKALYEVAKTGEIGVQAPFSQSQWDILAQVVLVLKPFKDTSETLSAATATLSQVIPIVKLLGQKMASFLSQDGAGGEELKLVPEVVGLVQRLQQQIIERLEPLTWREEFMLATMCDPRVKGSVALYSASLSHWKQELVERVCKAQRQRSSQEGVEGEPPSETSSPSSTVTTPSCSTAGQAMWAQAVGAAVGNKGSTQPWELDSAETSVAHYLDEPVEDPSSDPLTYWAHKGQVWPDLAKVAQQLLSCPPTSVPSKRVFSMTGDFLSPNRSRLTPELVEQLVFLKVNLPLLGFPEMPCDTE